MGTEDIKISVIIVNWNAGDLLLKCVRSIIADQDRSGLQNVEIVVIDNASSDGSINSIKLLYSKIGCIQNSENLGFAHANNQGIHSATGQYVLLLNPDTEIRPGALSEMVRFMESHPKVGAVGPMLLNNDGSLQISAYPEPSLFREMWRLFYFDGFLPIGSYPMNAWHPEIPREVDVLMGACILLRREVLSQCGLLDDRYFIYSEDQDYCRRIRSGGWKIFWLPRAQVVHYGGQSTQQVKGDMFVRLYREKINYFRMHYGDSVATRYKILLLVASIIRLLLSPLALLKSSPQRSRACELARFYGRLVKELPAL